MNASAHAMESVQPSSQSSEREDQKAPNGRSVILIDEDKAVLRGMQLVAISAFEKLTHEDFS